MLDKNVAIKIGKTVIETLTQGMYEDARFVYREYIQNAADAIDKAVEDSILESRTDGEIFIRIEKENARIVIEDNGTGIKHAKVLDMLGNIALSEKDRAKDKGFRGIGRLGGLGYCDTLIFETSYAGEPVKTIMKWDAFDLRQKLFDKNITGDAGEIVKSVVTISEETEIEDKHYFKVMLESVDNDTLLDVPNIREYLSMVAPVPFSTSFYYKTEIYKYADEKGYSIDEYKIFINENILYKPYVL
jgi:molecular chaperone HtpG